MNTARRNTLKGIMQQAWQFVKRNGYTMSQALKCAWLNAKLKKDMAGRIAKFWYTKVDGSLREAYGTLKEALCPPTQGTGRKPNDTLQVYYDTEAQGWRSFKKANLVKMA